MKAKLLHWIYSLCAHILQHGGYSCIKAKYLRPPYTITEDNNLIKLKVSTLIPLSQLLVMNDDVLFTEINEDHIKKLQNKINLYITTTIEEDTLYPRQILTSSITILKPNKYD